MWPEIQLIGLCCLRRKIRRLISDYSYRPMCFRQIELPNFDHYLPTSYQVFEQQDVNANIQEDTISLPVIATPIENDTIDKVLQLRHGVRKTTRIFGWILIFNKDFCQMLT